MRVKQEWVNDLPLNAKAAQRMDRQWPSDQNCGTAKETDVREELRLSSCSFLRPIYWTLFVFAIHAVLAQGQVASDISSLIGMPPHARTQPVRFGQLNLDTGDMHLEIPLYSTTERGLNPNSLFLSYDSFFWSSTQAFGLNTGVPTALYPTGTGWSTAGGDTNGGLGAQPVGGTVTNCSSQRAGDFGTITVYQQWVSTDWHGTQHSFNLYSVYNTCSFPTGAHDSLPEPQSSGGTAYALDGSGYFLSVTASTYGLASYVLAPNGTGPGANGTLSGSESPNGNVYSQGNFDELGGSSVATAAISGVPGNCFGPGQSTLAITLLGQVISQQPYAAQSPITCTMTMPSWNGANQQSANAQYTFVYVYEPVCTKFYSDSLEASDYTGGMWLLQSVALPGGLGSYSFQYDTGTSGTHLGVLTQITLPTGGTVGYTYGTPPSSSSATNDTPFVTSVADQEGTTAIAYNSPTDPYPETITYPAHLAAPGQTATVQDKRVISAGSSPNGEYPEPPYTIVDYSGSTPIQSTVENRDNANRITSVTSTWSATGESHEVALKYADDPSLTGYQSYGGIAINMIGQESEYNSETLVRTMTIQYMKSTSSINYVSTYNMINYPLSQTLQDGSGNTIAQTLYTYDEYSASYCTNSHPVGLSGIPMLTSITGASGHDDSRGSSYYARGNVTTIQRLVSPGVYVTTHNCYDTLGNVTQTIDGNGNATRYSYSDNYLETACIPAGSSTYAFPTLVTNPLGQTATTAYYTCNRQAGQVKSPNDISNGSNGTTTNYDVAGRLLCVKTPDTAQNCKSYPGLNEVDTTNALGDKTEATLDLYGRATKQIDTGSTAEVDTSYDAFGRTNCVSNPYYPSAGSSGKTCYAYDPLSRVTGTLYADGSSLLTNSYNGNTVTTTDPLSNKWSKKMDSLGRLITVLEPNGSSHSPSMETDYTYDVLNNLKLVTQWGGANGSPGSRGRSFSYDGLSRLISSTNPESGSATYSYDNNGNLFQKASPAVNSASGTQTVGFCYDASNRMTYKFYASSFSCTSPSGYAASYSYDSGATNGIGLLTDEKAYSGNTLVSERKFTAYDSMGRLLNESQYILGNLTASPAYAYDLAGDVVASTDGATPIQSPNQTYPCTAPSAVSAWTHLAVVNCYDQAGRASSVTSNWSTYPVNMFTAGSSLGGSTNGWAAFGGLLNWTQGPSVSGSPALLIQQGFDNRLRLNSISANGQIP